MKDEILDIIEKIVEQYDAERGNSYICFAIEDLQGVCWRGNLLPAARRLADIVIEDVRAEVPTNDAFFDGEEIGNKPSRHTKLWYLMLLWHQIQDGTIKVEY